MPAATEQEDASGGRGADDERREGGRDINIRSRGFTAPFAWLPALGRFCKTKCLVSESLTAERVHTHIHARARTTCGSSRTARGFTTI